MKNIEQSYLNNLVQKAQQGSSNAFAELTAAVYRRHYSYLLYMLGDDNKVINCLKNVYVQILYDLKSLGKPDLYMPWSARICYRRCFGDDDHKNMNMKIRTPAGQISLFLLYTLPLTESQIMIMRYKQKLSVKAIGNILNFDKYVVKRCIKAAVRHLKRIPGRNTAEQSEGTDSASGLGQETLFSEIRNDVPHDRRKRSDVLMIQEILDDVFQKCSKKPNNVPIEALMAYASYRKERFSLQRGILTVALILFLLLPILFIAPYFEVSAVPVGERGLPVVTVDVRPGLPVGKVLAYLNKHSLPVYEAGAFEYTMEPTRNGTMTIKVELINRQSLTKEFEMEYADSDGPELRNSSTDDKYVFLTVADEGIGIDYREIYAKDEEGNLHYPVSYDEETGEIVFEYPETQWDVYIPDHIGNRLHLSFVFE